MSDEIEDSLHDKIVKAFIRYCTANEKFENFGYIQSARDARAALNDISPLIKHRRKEIQETRIKMHGNPMLGIEPTEPSERRQRKIDRQRQKEQKEASNNNETPCNAMKHSETPRGEESRVDINTPIPPTGAKTQNSAIGLPTWLTTIKAKGEDPIPADDPVFEYADSVGIPRDHLRLAWREFRERYSLPGAKRYKNWRTVFGKAVRGNWFKLWHFAGDACALTTTGVQAKRAAEANAGVAA